MKKLVKMILVAIPALVVAAAVGIDDDRLR